MAFTNLPPNLQDMFYNLQDQINKLLLAPNAAMAAAESAQYATQGVQSVADNAQVQATNALVAANLAASQATIAQSQATIASSQATLAQTTADGKNKTYYSTSTPGSTANNAGDIWYQYGTSGTYANKVIAQWSGAGGTSWTSVTVSGLILANLDAGTVTTGVLNAIEINAGSGGTSFHVSPSGYMSAQGVYVKGNITADSGTFTGSIYAGAGAFGQLSGNTLINGWSIGSTGITGVGSGTITGGAINGSVITGGTIQTSAGTDAVILNSSSNSLTFKTASTNVGYILPLNTGGASPAYGILMHYGATADPTGGTRPQLFVGSTNVSLQANTTNIIATSTSGLTLTGTVLSDFNLSSTSDLRVPYAYSTTVSNAATVWISSTGQLRRSTASSERYKTDIVNLTDVPELDPKALYSLPVRAFRFKPEYLSETDDRANALVPGFIAEEVDAVYPIAADYMDNVETWNDRMLVPAMLSLIQDLNNRVKTMEGK